MTVKLLNKHHLEFLSLKGGCTSLSESALVKKPHFWKSHVVAHLFSFQIGIAVGDIDKIQKQAYIKRIGLQVKFVIFFKTM